AQLLQAPQLKWSGYFGAGFGEGEPLVAEVGDYLQAAAEGFDVGGQGAQFPHTMIGGGSGATRLVEAARAGRAGTACHLTGCVDCTVTAAVGRDSGVVGAGRADDRIGVRLPRS